jgi:L,D-peptidoglycan transpeptidase YkuD (ErfK/YbiS/YcfS/YnhG family)
MKKMMQWVFAATLVCGISVFTACSNNDDPVTVKGQLLEVYDVQGSAGKARLTVDGKVLFVTDVFVGKNGLGKTGEGDGKTPIGTLHPLSAFGVKPNPGTKMPSTLM